LEFDRPLNVGAIKEGFPMSSRHFLDTLGIKE
jgi:hypothetical protein